MLAKSINKKLNIDFLNIQDENSNFKPKTLAPWVFSWASVKRATNRDFDPENGIFSQKVTNKKCKASQFT